MSTLLEALSSADPSTRLQAAMRAGTHPSPELVEPLIARCSSEPDFFVRDMLTWALTRHPADVTVPLLLAEVRTGGSQARSQALHTLSKIGDPRAWPLMTAALVSDPDDDVVRSAWRAAVVVAPERDRAELARTLATQLGRGDRDVQLSLSQALAALGEAAAPALAEAAAHADPRVREHAHATERILRDPDEGFDAAIHEAKRTFALKDAPMPQEDSVPPNVAVIGGGVIGLTVAHELAAAGARVTLHRDAAPEDTVSAIAAAIWFPFEAWPLDRVTAWSEQSRLRFERIAAQPASGVRMMPGIIVRSSEEEPPWRDLLPHARPATPAELSPGVPAGWSATLPVIEMPVYLRWLEHECAELGVSMVQGRVASVDDLSDADAVVVAAGLASASLIHDPVENYPIRGQVVRVQAPGVQRWVLDVGGEHPTYVIPRSADVVVGGTADASDDLRPDPVTEDAMLERARALVPELAHAEVLSRIVGLRPGRSAVRVEPVEGHAVPVIACYGHGGAGVTTSWGCATTVVQLVGEALAAHPGRGVSTGSRS